MPHNKMYADYHAQRARGDLIGGWLAEKLAYGQLRINRQMTDAHGNRCPYWIVVNNDIVFYILKVNGKYWKKLILPGLKDWANKLNCRLRITYAPEQRIVGFRHMDPLVKGL